MRNLSIASCRLRFCLVFSLLAFNACLFGKDGEDDPIPGPDAVLECLDCHGWRGAAINDTVRFVARWEGEGKGQISLSWSLDGSGKPLKTLDGIPAAGMDTLVWVAPSMATQFQLHFQIKDSHGYIQKGSLAVSVTDEPVPLVFRGDTSVSLGDTVALTANLTNYAIGRIVKEKWDDCGGEGRMLSRPGLTQVIAPEKVDTLYCEFSATDEAGYQIFYTLAIATIPLVYLNAIPGFEKSAGHYLINFGDSLLCLRADGVIVHYNPETDGWKRVPIPVPTFAASFKSPVLSGAHLFASNYGEWPYSLAYLDIAAKSWVRTADIPSQVRYNWNNDYTQAVGDGKLYLVPKRSLSLQTAPILQYEIATDSWSEIPFEVPEAIGEISGFSYYSLILRPAFFAGQLRILAFGDGFGTAFSSYDSEKGTWSHMIQKAWGVYYGSFFATRDRLWISDRRTAYQEPKYWYSPYNYSSSYSDEGYPGSANIRYFDAQDKLFHPGIPVPVGSEILDPLCDPRSSDFLSIRPATGSKIYGSHILWYQGENHVYATFSVYQNFNSGALHRDSYYLLSDNGLVAIFRQP